jgi:hypothetical protein
VQKIPDMTCSAVTRKGLACKKSALPRFKFCRVHCFGRISETPWYYNALVLALAGFLASAVLAWYFFDRGPSSKKQDEILSAIHDMQDAEHENSDYLKSHFPYGYVILTVNERRETVPLESPMDKTIKLDFGTETYFRLTPSRIELKLPNITFLNPDGTTVLTQWKDIRLSTARTNHIEFGLQTFGAARITNNIMVSLLSVENDKAIAAMGLTRPINAEEEWRKRHPAVK